MSSHRITGKPDNACHCMLGSFAPFHMRKALFVLIFSSGALLMCAGAAPAGALPANATLTITAGIGGGVSTSLPGTGSKFSMDAFSDGSLLWTIVKPGTQGGIVIGTTQSDGGQMSLGGGTNSTPGQIDVAWKFFGNYGTDFTYLTALQPSGDTANKFSECSCVGDQCIGNTVLASWGVSWNQSNNPDGIPMGAGIVDAWTVSGTDYSLDYRQTVPSDSPSFPNVAYGLHLEGTIVYSGTPPPTPNCSATATPTPTVLTGTIPCPPSGCSGQSGDNGRSTNGIGHATLDVPAGALGSEVDLTLNQIQVYKAGPPQVPAGLVDSDTLYISGGPAGTTFAVPATLCIQWDTSNPIDTSLLRLGVVESGGTQWAIVAGSGYDGSTSPPSVCGEINGFSDYGVISIAGPAGTTGGGCGVVHPTGGGRTPPGSGTALLLSLFAPVIWLLGRRSYRFLRKI